MSNDDVIRVQDIAELRTREALRELIGGYCRAADNCDAERLAELFHPDGLVDSGVIRAKPGEFARQFVEWLHRHTASVFHAICGAQFEISGEEAAGDIQVVAFCQMNETHGGRRIVTAGYYKDRYAMLGSKWVIRERIFTPKLSWDLGPQSGLPQQGQ